MSDRIEDKDSDIALIDKMISSEVFKEPEADEGTEEYYDPYALQFTDKFDHDFKETLLRLGSDPSNESLGLFEGLKSVILNYLKEKIDEDELDRMVMMVFSLKTVNEGIETK
jgi:hypothetical protein